MDKPSFSFVILLFFRLLCSLLIAISIFLGIIQYALVMVDQFGMITIGLASMWFPMYAGMTMIFGNALLNDIFGVASWFALGFLLLSFLIVLSLGKNK